MMAYTYWRTLPLLALHFFWPPLLPLLRYDMLLQSRCAGNHAWAQQGTQVCSHRFWRHPVREEALSSLDMYARSVCCKKQCRWRYIPDNRRTEVVIVSAIVLVLVLVSLAAIFVGWRWGSYQVYSTVSSYIYIYKDRQWFDPGWFAGMPYHILFGPDTGQHELCMIKQRSASTYKAYYDIAVSAEVMHSVRSHSGLWSEYSGQWKCFVISTSSALKRQVSFGFCLWIVQDTWVRGLERDCATRQGHHRWCLPSSATS